MSVYSLFDRDVTTAILFRIRKKTLTTVWKMLCMWRLWASVGDYYKYEMRDNESLN